MVLRKARLEALDAINARDRLISLQKVYRKDDIIHTKPLTRKLEDAKHTRISHLEAPGSWVECVEGEIDGSGAGCSKNVEDAEMQRDRKKLTKYVSQLMHNIPLSKSELINGMANID